ncbi:hypothetical protein BCR32DRAFT_301487 [Anaeromyces robustus]|uniref:Uncharacterized protein n=1 Tax=Anaeromyces robustus TaxID=1754192 RepID=A0A1Y1WZ81_9FUNG|nr:hypothetical protein BCR32DRAFT_301487 [Anaeromyces robustus]|eukprot:ORX78705.1 hypothetical protein BCR32DRAFT_301487 [Anaeromyces robustus]
MAKTTNSLPTNGFSLEINDDFNKNNTTNNLKKPLNLPSPFLNCKDPLDNLFSKNNNNNNIIKLSGNSIPNDKWLNIAHTVKEDELNLQFPENENQFKVSSENVSSLFHFSPRMNQNNFLELINPTKKTNETLTKQNQKMNDSVHNFNKCIYHSENIKNPDLKDDQKMNDSVHNLNNYIYHSENLKNHDLKDENLTFKFFNDFNENKSLNHFNLLLTSVKERNLNGGFKNTDAFTSTFSTNHASNNMMKIKNHLIFNNSNTLHYNSICKNQIQLYNDNNYSNHLNEKINTFTLNETNDHYNYDIYNGGKNIKMNKDISLNRLLFNDYKIGENSNSIRTANSLYINNSIKSNTATVATSTTDVAIMATTPQEFLSNKFLNNKANDMLSSRILQEPKLEDESKKDIKKEEEEEEEYYIYKSSTADCDHVFCLDCIKVWRRTDSLSRELTRKCPVCQKISLHFIPSDIYCHKGPLKSHIIERFRTRCSRIPCRFYEKRGPNNSHNCPFGNECLFLHRNPDGTNEKLKNLKIDSLIKNNCTPVNINNSNSFIQNTILQHDNLDFPLTPNENNYFLMNSQKKKEDCFQNKSTNNLSYYYYLYNKKNKDNEKIQLNSYTNIKKYCLVN